MQFKEELSKMRTFIERSDREVRRLQQENDLAKKVVEEIQNHTVVMEVIKAEAIKKNEELQSSRNRFFYALNKILKAKSDQKKLSVQVKEMNEKYKKSLEAYNWVTKWKDVEQSFPETLPVYSGKKRNKDHRLSSAGITIIAYIQRT